MPGPTSATPSWSSKAPRQANASNPDGWGAITAVSLAAGQPHLPNWLACRLPTADSSIYVIPARGELAERATVGDVSALTARVTQWADTIES